MSEHLCSDSAGRRARKGKYLDEDIIICMREQKVYSYAFYFQMVDMPLQRHPLAPYVGMDRIALIAGVLEQKSLGSRPFYSPTSSILLVLILHTRHELTTRGLSCR